MRTTRRPERRSRGAHRDEWCRMLKKKCRQRSGLQSQHFRCSARRDVDERRRGDSERRREGYGQRSDFGEPGAAVAALAAAAAALWALGRAIGC